MFESIKQIFRRKPELKPIGEADPLEDYGYRPIGDSKNHKALSQLNRDEQLRLVFNLWLKNGFAKRLIQIIIDFVVGKEMYTPEFRSKDDNIPEEKLKACSDLIADFNEKNKFPSKFKKFATDLGLNGMLLLPCIDSANGDVTIGFIDPSRIDKVTTSPFDVTDVVTVKMKSDFLSSERDTTFFIVRKLSAFDQPKDSGNEKDYDLLYGDAFFFAVNNVSNQPEGVSDLLADIDMIHKLYELIINVVDSVKLANMFVLDVSIEGASAKEIKEWKLNNPIPTRPSRFIHNQKVTQQLLGTNIRSFNAPDVVRVIKNFILGNFSLPPMWFADGEDANRAIAIEQGTPIYKKLSDRQEVLIDILNSIYLYVIHSAVRNKEGFVLKKEDLENLILEIKAPEIQIKNLDKITTALEKLTGSFEKAQSNKWLTTKTIRRAFISFANLLSFNINTEAEESAIETEKELEPDPEPNPNLEDIKNKKPDEENEAA